MPGIRNDIVMDIVRVFSLTPKSDREYIQNVYHSLYNQSLSEKLDEYLSAESNDIKMFIQDLALGPSYFDAKLLYDAINNDISNADDVLVEIMISRSYQEKQEIKKVYQNVLKKDLEKHLKEKFTEDFLKLLISLSIGLRDNSTFVNFYLAHCDAERLYSSGEAQFFGTDESVFNQIFVSRNFAHLRQVFEYYEKVSRLTIEKSLENEFSSSILHGLLQLTRYTRNKSKYFADKLEDKDSMLRIFLTLSENDLYEVIEEYGGIEKIIKLIERKIPQDFGRILHFQYRADQINSDLLVNKISQWRHVYEILAQYTNDERQVIALRYKDSYGEELRDVLGRAMQQYELALALIDRPIEYDARLLYNAINRPGTDEDVLIEIFITRKYEEIMEIRKEYKETYGTDLYNDLDDDLSGMFKYFIFSIAGYNENRVKDNSTDIEKAKKDALNLMNPYNTTQCICLLSSLNLNQLRLIFDEYQKLSNQPIETLLNNERDDDLRSGFLQIVKVVRDTPKYFAEKLYNAVAGFGTDNDALRRIIVTRSEIDLPKIMSEFTKQPWKMSLRDAIWDEDITNSQISLTDFLDNYHGYTSKV
ncbi:unnamed protein product [Caenorhabditis angaria]|uniref:Annexin n=1 Tax=Caenorhabditis angaria TaxID=860376 RepID=A0A9P1ICF2_9PELO|nr:unnamed protein product [Caenorhabditis angaria]